MNPVDDQTFTRPLVRDLRRHVDACAESMTDLPSERRRPVAVAWVYTSALVAWAEQHNLVHPWLRKAGDYVPDAGPDGMRVWLAHAFRSLGAHPATRCLLDPRWTPLWEAVPSEDACRALVRWWATAPSLVYDTDEGPASITGWLVGDLLQALSDERRKGYALCQTPWWVADGIIDLTLVPAAGEFVDQTLTTIDPACGTGHFLIRKVDYLWQLYTTGALACRSMRTPGSAVSGWTPVGAQEAIRRILAGVTGVDIDPLTTAVARLRMVVTIGDLMHRAGLLAGPLRLDAIPATVRPRVAVGDSLLAGKVPAEEYARLHPAHAAIYGLRADHADPDATPVQLDLLDTPEAGT